MVSFRVPRAGPGGQELAILVLLSAVVMVFLLPGVVHGAQVKVNLKCQLMESGATVETLTLGGGGSPSPATALCTPAGTTTQVTVTVPTTLTVTVQADGSSSRYRGNSSWTAGTGVSLPVSAATSFVLYNYFQLQNTYQVDAVAQSDFDTGMSWLVNGTILGVDGSTVCTVYSTASTSDSCPLKWVDYDSTVAFPPWAAAPAGPWRWGLSSKDSATFNDITGGHTDQVHYVKQVQEDFSYSVTGGGSGYGSPTLVCFFLDTSKLCNPLTTAPQAYWLDFGSDWSANGVLPGSNNNERWSSDSAAGVASQGGLANIPYFNQYSVGVGYNAVEGGTPPPFTISYNLYGVLTPSSPTQAQKPYWMDAGQSFTVSLPQGTSTERWRSPFSYSVYNGAMWTIQLHHQYSLQLSYAVNGGGSGYFPPTLTYSNFSKPITVNLVPSSQYYWADSGTPWSVSGSLAGGSLAERWQTNATLSGQVSGPISEPLPYYHQYYVAFSYGVLGGGSGYSPPTVKYTKYGATVVGTQDWADAGQRFSYTDPLVGSSQLQRWDSNDSSGTVRGPGIVNATYYRQYAFDLSYVAVSPSEPTGGPELDFTAFGVAVSQPLGSSPPPSWLDAGSAWSVEPRFGVLGANERWATLSPTAGLANSSVSISFTYYDQFYVTVGYDIEGGGSPKTPQAAYTAFASPSTIQLANRSKSAWVDAGSTLTLPNLLPGSSSLERWIAQGPTIITATTPIGYEEEYSHQFFLKTMPNSAAGGDVLNSTKWYDSGASVLLNASAFPGWEFAYWEGVGSTAYNGTQASKNFTLSGPAEEVAQFYPGLTIIVSGGGRVLYTDGALNGSVSSGRNLIYVPLESNVTLKASPLIFDIIFEGWSQAASGRASQISLHVGAPLTVGASFGLDYSDIGVIAAFIPLVVVLAIYILVVRRLPAKRP